MGSGSQSEREQLLEIRVAKLESLARLLHPDVFSDFGPGVYDLEEGDLDPLEPDPDETREERKRSWGLIIGEGGAGTAGVAAIAADGAAHARQHPLIWSLGACAAAIGVTLAVLLPVHSHHALKSSTSPRAPASMLEPRPRRRAVIPKPRKPPRPNPTHDGKLITNPNPTPGASTHSVVVAPRPQPQPSASSSSRPSSSPSHSTGPPAVAGQPPPKPALCLGLLVLGVCLDASPQAGATTEAAWFPPAPRWATANLAAPALARAGASAVAALDQGRPLTYAASSQWN